MLIGNKTRLNPRFQNKPSKTRRGAGTLYFHLVLFPINWCWKILLPWTLPFGIQIDMPQCSAADCVLIFIGAAACTAPKFCNFTEANMCVLSLVQCAAQHRHQTILMCDLLPGRLCLWIFPWSLRLNFSLNLLCWSDNWTWALWDQPVSVSHQDCRNLPHQEPSVDTQILLLSLMPPYISWMNLHIIIFYIRTASDIRKYSCFELHLKIHSPSKA